ncbi:MAG: CBS domain-containing protein [Candidatus Latescibacteria bacterium]|nr:CBS domain-containing protein [Candidatus Latescibacterota bacterium]NIO28434.1 CBS domain-containing protein [Candidatus Latescibacterota bacterium]NIO55983.1 CBS domain-containing protein [Candidatus Latescibacterota bacterium]NIT01947.1 CBS domain-containing protein [Candidatus Latescibacterota bacterium]
MTTVKKLLDTKGRDVWTVSPHATVLDALRLMAEKGVGALVVLDGENIIGIFSERDYARKVALKGKSSRSLSVREIMTDKVVYVRPDQTIEESMAIMTDKRVRHLPVCENDKLIGIVSIGDVVKAIISNQQFIIEQLENYITGSR